VRTVPATEAARLILLKYAIGGSTPPRGWPG
jgi:hypothetical protein